MNRDWRMLSVTLCVTHTHTEKNPDHLLKSLTPDDNSCLELLCHNITKVFCAHQRNRPAEQTPCSSSACWSERPPLPPCQPWVTPSHHHSGPLPHSLLSPPPPPAPGGQAWGDLDESLDESPCVMVLPGTAGVGRRFCKVQAWCVNDCNSVMLSHPPVHHSFKGSDLFLFFIIIIFIRGVCVVKRPVSEEFSDEKSL